MQYTDYFTIFTFGSGIIVALITGGWVAANFLNKKFAGVHDNIDIKIGNLEKNIISKLEYHERHDDERFSAIDKSVWEIRVRNAGRDRAIANAV